MVTDVLFKKAYKEYPILPVKTLSFLHIKYKVSVDKLEVNGIDVLVIKPLMLWNNR